MDTDDLSEESYRAVIIEAEKFNENLTLQFGLLSYSCKNEMEYLTKAKELIADIRKMSQHDLSDLFFGSPPKKEALFVTLNKMLENISAVEKIPESKRKYTF